MNDTEIAYPPEGLHLVITDQGPHRPPSFTIEDAQDIEWIVFRLGATGDPASWRTAIVMACCKALGITDAAFIGDDICTMALDKVPSFLYDLRERPHLLDN